MATITPDEGLDFTKKRVLDEPETAGWEMFQVAVGSGSANLSATDTQLDVEEYRANKTDSVVTIEDSTPVGEVLIRITVSGGTEVPAGTTITEFGIFGVDTNDAPSDDTEDAKDRLLHRELRSGITLKAGDTKTFEIRYLVESK